jgi:hypothetical protein
VGRGWRSHKGARARLEGWEGRLVAIFLQKATFFATRPASVRPRMHKERRRVISPQNFAQSANALYAIPAPFSFPFGLPSAPHSVALA